MSKSWMIFVLLVSFFLLASLKSQEVRSLHRYHRPLPTLKLSQFAEAKTRLPPEDHELLELWESMLTGRSAPLGRLMKQNFETLGLTHVFTPSGFHLSAVLWPLLLLFKSARARLSLLLTISAGLCLLPGFAALKRMCLIKLGQTTFDQKAGFLLALLLDILFGSFQAQPLSFTYSFVFLGIIYSGVRGLGLVVWFFLAQMILAYFQGVELSPALLLLSPLFNFLIGLLMPLLFLLSWPLSAWEADLGLFFLRYVNELVRLAGHLTRVLPLWEIHLGTLLLGWLFLIRKPRLFVFALFIFCCSLNSDHALFPREGKHQFVPARGPWRMERKADYDLVIYRDGRCKRKLVRGIWFENCSPARRRGSRKKG